MSKERLDTDIPIFLASEEVIISGADSEAVALHYADTAELPNPVAPTMVSALPDQVIKSIELDDGREEAVFYTDYSGLPEQLPILSHFLTNMTGLGSGGMGVVYRAEVAGLKVNVAYKEFRMSPKPGETAADITAREAMTDEIFRNEVEKTQAGSRFASGPRILEAGRNVQGRPYVVMELFEGEDLVDVICAEFNPQDGSRSSYDPMSIEDKLLVSMGLAKDLDALHSQNMVHRDVKPANIKVTEKNVHLLDYGIAKLVGEQLSFEKPGALYGTPAYMAPEVACGLGETAFSDQYSLGVVMYEMFTGVNPIKKEDDTGIFARTDAYHNIARPDEISNVPTDIADVIMRALSYDWRKRYTSCGDMLEDLYAAYDLHHGEAGAVMSKSGNAQDDIVTAELPVEQSPAMIVYDQAIDPAGRGARDDIQ
ncbi:serine/threonine protein kinase [Candidatus Woesearchaeota archaeon]|nr:serine/threonine protein kinase [Candidatus Woesearchaeota archaeon]